MEIQQTIKNRIAELDDRMAIIEETMSSEMRKPFYNRRFHLLSFLRKEQSVYDFALSELRALQKERFIAHSRSIRSWPKSTSKALGKVKRKSFLIQITSGLGLGDALLVTPSFRAIKRQYPGSKIVVIARFPLREVLKRNPQIDQLPPLWIGIFHKLFAFLRGKAIHNLKYGNLQPSLFYKVNAAEIIAEMMGLKLEDCATEVFMTKKEDEKARVFLAAHKNPIIMNPSTIASRNKQWYADRWEQLVKSMPEFTFIQLGLKDEEPLIDGAVDMRGRTQIRESIGLVKHALCYVGVDSFLSHVADAVHTPGVILFGPTSPVVWGHETNINLYKQTQCSPCVDILRHDACPYDRECIDGITVEEVRGAILKQMRRQTLSEVPVAVQTIASARKGLFRDAPV